MADQEKTRAEIIAEGYGITVEEAIARDKEQQAKRERLAARRAAALAEAEKPGDVIPVKKSKSVAAVADDPKAA